MMDWVQVGVIVVSTVGLCWVFSGETKTKADKLADYEREHYKEMKDFHGRMCALEQKYIQMMEKHLEEKKNE